ncbi:MAG: sulfatase [Thermoanaerobaculia bacterium]
MPSTTDRRRLVRRLFASGKGSSRAVAGALAGLLASLLAAGCATEASGPRHVFLITVDTLRADHLGLYGYPRATSEFLEELAVDGVVFERAIAQWPATGSSFASIFTGLYPHTTGLTQGAAVELSGEYLTLAELLSAKGFATAAVVSNGVLRRSMGWGQGFDEFLETWALAPEEPDDPVEYRQWLHAGRVNELALPLLDRMRNEERVFVWLHYSDPHAPYYLPEGVENPFLGDPWDVGDELAKIRRRVQAKALGENRDLRYYVAHYDANIQITDRHIREALGRARGLGLLDDALIVFTSDHGESLGEHGYFFGHGRLPYNASAHVPLMIVRTRGGVARRVENPVELVDLYPTLRSLVAPDLEAPGLEGDSLVPLLGTDAAAHREALTSFQLAFSQAGGGGPRTQFRSVQDGRWKLILRPERRAGKARPEKWRLFRLDQDPMESRDLAQSEAAQVRRLRPLIEEWMKGSASGRRPRQPEGESEEVRKALRALGYVD